MSSFIKTPQADAAKQMCEAVLAGRKYGRMGQIIGDPGTGKSSLAAWLADEFGAIHVECWAKMAKKSILQEIAIEFEKKHTVAAPVKGTADTFFRWLRDQDLNGVLIIADEANQLSWATIEVLRGLSDRGAGVVLVGTGVLTRTLKLAQSQIYTQQIRQRIGSKSIEMSPIDGAAKLAAYTLAPRFDQVTKSGATAFYQKTGGYWRAAVELADACERLMKNENLDKLDDTVVATAAAWMAGAK